MCKYVQSYPSIEYSVWLSNAMFKETGHNKKQYTGPKYALLCRVVNSGKNVGQ